MNKKIIKRRFTLMEMMIVMAIIASLITVLGVKYAGSLDESKALRTKAAIERLSGILSLKAANDPSFLDRISAEWSNVVNNSPMVNDPNSLIYDAWGNRFDVSVDGYTIVIRSPAWEEYSRTHESNFSR